MPAASVKSNIVRTQKSATDLENDGSFASKISHLLDGKAWLDAFEVVGAEQNANSASRSAEFCGIGWRMYLPKFVAVELLLTSRGNGEFVASSEIKEFYFNSVIEAENLTTSYNSLALAVEQKLLPSYTLPNSVYVILELQLTVKSMNALFRGRCDSFSHETNSIVDAMITVAKQYFPSALGNINPLTIIVTNAAVNHSDPEIELPFEEDEPEHDSTELEPVVVEAISALPEPEPEHEVEPELEPEPEHDLNIEITEDLSPKVDAVPEIIIETKIVETPKEEAPVRHEDIHNNITIPDSPVSDVERRDNRMSSVKSTTTIGGEKESAAQSISSADEEKSSQEVTKNPSPDSNRIVAASVPSRKQVEPSVIRSRVITSPVRARREPEIQSRKEPSESETQLRKEKEEPTIKRQNIVSPVRLKREPEQPTVRSRKDEEPEIKSRKNEEPEVRSRKDEESEVRSRKNEEPEVRSRKNEEPEVRSRKDEEPEVKSHKGEEYEVRSRKNGEPPIRRQNVISPVRSRKNEEPEVRSRKDEEPEVRSRKNEEPAIKSRKNEEPEVRSRKDEEPAIKSRKNEELEVRSRKDEEPEVRSRKDEEPEVRSRKDEEPEVRSRKDEEPAIKSRKNEELPIRRQNVISPVRSRKNEESEVRSRKDEEPEVRSRKDEEPVPSKSRAIISPIRSKREPDDSESQSAKPVNDNSTPQIRSRVVASPVRSRQRAVVEPARRVVMSPVRNISTRDKDSSQEKDDIANLKYKSSTDYERDLDDANYRPKDKNRAVEAAPSIRTVKLAVSPIWKAAVSDDEAKAEDSAPKVKRLTIVKNVKDETETRQPSPRRKVVPSPIKVFVVTGDGETANLVTKAKVVPGKRTIRVSAASPTRVLPGTRNPSV